MLQAIVVVAFIFLLTWRPNPPLEPRSKRAKPH